MYILIKLDGIDNIYINTIIVEFKVSLNLLLLLLLQFMK
jgi:hypothetical protein